MGDLTYFLIVMTNDYKQSEIPSRIDQSELSFFLQLDLGKVKLGFFYSKSEELDLMSEYWQQYFENDVHGWY